jgi:hypothetical protein
MTRSETLFSILQGQSLNGASFTAVEQLQEHIDAFIAAYNKAAVRVDQKEGLPAALQKSPYHPTVIPGSRVSNGSHGGVLDSMRSCMTQLAFPITRSLSVPSRLPDFWGPSAYSDGIARRNKK